MSLEVDHNGKTSWELKQGDSFVLPPSTISQYLHCSADLELLEVTIHGVT